MLLRRAGLTAGEAAQSIPNVTKPPKKGDLEGLKPSAELLAALSAMLPVIDREMPHAKAVEATAESAIDVLRRIRARK